MCVGGGGGTFICIMTIFHSTFIDLNRHFEHTQKNCYTKQFLYPRSLYQRPNGFTKAGVLGDSYQFH